MNGGVIKHFVSRTMQRMEGKRIEKILGLCTFLSLYAPILFYRKNEHDCRYDECMMIFYKGRLGCCIQDSLNDFCLFLAVAWWFVIVGGALVISKCKNETSPFVVSAIMLACCVLCAILDPSKWPFAIASLAPVTLFVVCAIFDNKYKTK